MERYTTGLMENLIAGIEIGGTKLQISLGRFNGELIYHIRGKVVPQKGALGILSWIKKNLSSAIEQASQLNGKVIGIGVGFGGPIETSSGRILKSVQIDGWDNFELKAWFEKNFGLPAIIANDTNAACWGEYCLGAGKGLKSFFYTNIGSGIGGGIVINGELYDGQGYGAAEFGQTYVPDWTSQSPGTEEKLENLCSGWAIEKRLRMTEKIPPTSKLMELCQGNKELITCKMLETAAKSGDAFALEEIDNIARTIGIALSNVLSLFSPECIAIGGGVSLMGRVLLDPICLHTMKHEFISSHNNYKIVRCQLGESIVTIGVILLAKESIYET